MDVKTLTFTKNIAPIFPLDPQWKKSPSLALVSLWPTWEVLSCLIPIWFDPNFSGGCQKLLGLLRIMINHSRVSPINQQTYFMRWENEVFLAQVDINLLPHESATCNALLGDPHIYGKTGQNHKTSKIDPQHRLIMVKLVIQIDYILKWS